MSFTGRLSLDLRAALAYLRTRPDRDPAGVGLFGVSRGGGTALVVAASDPAVWGVATDGAFPTRGTMLAYILRWAEIYVGSKTVWRRMPIWMFAFVGWAVYREMLSPLDWIGAVAIGAALVLVRLPGRGLRAVAEQPS